MLKKMLLTVAGLVFLVSLAFGSGGFPPVEPCQEFPGMILNPQKIELPDGQFIAQMAKGQTPTGGFACLGWDPKDPGSVHFFVDGREIESGFTTTDYFKPQFVTDEGIVGIRYWDDGEENSGADIGLYRPVAGIPAFQTIAEDCYLMAVGASDSKIFIVGEREGLATLWMVDPSTLLATVREFPLEDSPSYSLLDGGIAFGDGNLFIATTESASFGYAWFQTMRIVEIDAENFSVINSYLITDEDGNFPDEFIFGGISGSKMTGSVNGDWPITYDFLGEWHEYQSFTVCSNYDEISASGVGFIGDWVIGNMGHSSIFAKNPNPSRPLEEVGWIFNFNDGEMEGISVFSVSQTTLVLRAGYGSNFYTVNLGN